jgi:hypothetical protein
VEDRAHGERDDGDDFDDYRGQLRRVVRDGDYGQHGRRDRETACRDGRSVVVLEDGRAHAPALPVARRGLGA